jgi:hypothetical protein
MIIGICGKAGSGKDTTADFLVKNHGFVKVAFADVLKRIVREDFDFSDEQLFGPSQYRNEPDMRYPRPFTEEEKQKAVDALKSENALSLMAEYPLTKFLTPRHALQQLGTEWGRACYPNVWVDYALRVAARLAKGGYAYDAWRGLFPVSVVEGVMYPKTDVVISDVRFKNEVDAIKAAGGQVWRIERPALQPLPGQGSQHVSETEQDEIPDDSFSAIIENTGTLEDLENIVASVFPR